MHDHSKQESSWECTCVWKKKRTPIRGRVSILLLELTCCDWQRRFQVDLLLAPEGAPTSLLPGTARKVDVLGQNTLTVTLSLCSTYLHRRSCSSRTGWSCANFERTPDRAITKIRQQRTHRELRSTQAHGWVYTDLFSRRLDPASEHQTRHMQFFGGF